MKLQIENKSFTLNINRAVELGVLTPDILTPDKVLITGINAGDKVKYPPSGDISTIISISRFCDWLPNFNEDMYVTAGVCDNQWAVYTQPLRNKAEMLKYLNDNGYVKI